MRSVTVINLLIYLTLGIGLVFLLVAGILKCTSDRKNKSCSVHTVGTVVDQVYSAYNKNAQRTWHPVFEYTAGDRQYRHRSNFGSAKPMFEVGQRVAIRYNPDAPDEYLVEEMRIGKTLQTIFLCVGLGLLLLGSILPSVLIP